MKHLLNGLVITASLGLILGIAGCSNGIEADKTPSKNNMSIDGTPPPPEAMNATRAGGAPEEGIGGKGKKRK